VGSNPTGGMDAYVRLFCACVVLCVGSGLATSSSPVQGILPTAYKIRKLKRRPRPNKWAVEPNKETCLCILLLFFCFVCGASERGKSSESIASRQGRGVMILL
jgi:hypothetical protein